MHRLWDNISWFLILLSPILLALLHARRKKNRFPPGPKGWPIVGNIFDIGTLPHKSLFHLKQQHGPLVWLRFGSKNTMAILTANVAMELYKKHDSSFIDRSIVHTLESHNYHKSSMAAAPYNGYWRALKRLCTTELFIAKQMNNTKFVRQKCVDNTLSWIEQEVGTNIELTKFVFPSLFNMIGNLMVSRDLVDPYSMMASEFYTAMGEVMECLGRPNISDVFPCLKWFDLQGLRKKMDTHFGTTLNIISGLVEERMNEQREGREKKNDFLDILLDFEGTAEKDEPSKFSEHDISILILDMFLAGTGTISTTIEWALSELIRNPEIMIKTRDELAKVVGQNNKLDENDINKLHYLQAVVKETLRLHPPGPLLIPKKATQDVKFMGYDIPKGTQVLVNVWAIGRDEEHWEDYLTFKPERFIGLDINYSGQHFELIPFGSGRRTCVGLPLAHRMVQLILGSLIHEFEWELEAGAAQSLDMEETTGITARKLQPLKAIPKKQIFKS